QHVLGACFGEEVPPEVVERLDRFLRRAGVSVLWRETVPGHQRAQGAGRRSAQADQLEPPILVFLLRLPVDVAEDFADHADRESGMHSAALTTDDDLYRLVSFCPGGIGHCPSSTPVCLARLTSVDLPPRAALCPGPPRHARS